MSLSSFSISVSGTLLFLLLGASLFATFRGLRFLLEMIALSKERRATLSRLLPLGEAVITLTTVFLALPWVFEDDDTYSPLVFGLLVLCLMGVSWFAIRDFVSGLFLKGGKVCQVGDQVRLDGVQGRVGKMGMRAIEITTAAGDEVIVPYSRVSRQAISRLPIIEGLARHRFNLRLLEGASPLRAKEVAWTTALNDHWASLKRDPHIDILSDGTLDITIYALTPDHGPVMERSIRAQIEAIHTPT